MESSVVIWLAIIIICSIIGTGIAHLFRLPRALVLLVLGVVVQFLPGESGLKIVTSNLHNPIISTIITGALVFSVLDHAVQLNFHEWGTFIHGFAKFSIARIILTIGALVLLAYFTNSLMIPAVLIGLLVCAGAPELLRKKHSSETMLLHTDAVVSSSLSIAGIFLFIAAANSVSAWSGVQKTVIGFFVTLASGLFLGLLCYRAIHTTKEPWTRLIVFALGILAFVLGEKFAPGLGIIAVLGFGLFLANAKLPHEFLHGKWISGIAEGIVFILIGLFIPLSQTAWIAGIIIFVAVIVSRYIAVLLFQHRMHKAVVCLINPL
ncbi:MAG: hypothetical protein Q7K43_00980, partial [Candidatus Woesearchaeota archaeon]|nr:hypothetical protein [Candidatus Woesearchaeota archaeon]